MWKKVGGHHAVSTEGQEIRFFGRDELIYTEHRHGSDDRAVTVYAGLLLGRASRSIEAGPRVLKRWNAPHETEEISEEHRKHIASSIAEALDCLKISYEFT